MRGATRRIARRLVAAAFGGLLAASAAPTPLELLPVGEPVEAELRVLDMLDPGPLGGRLRLPRLHTRPLARYEFQGTGAPAALPHPYGFSVLRIERELMRDAVAGFAPRAGVGSTPRLVQHESAEGARLDVSAGVEALGLVDRDSSRFASGSGLHARFGASLDRWLAFAHLVVGRIENARDFADPVVSGSDLIAYTGESYLAYASASGDFGAQLGRNRWHWGPGEEAALTLSKTAPAITGLEFHGRIRSLSLDLTALSATLQASGGEQLAAHRIEWQPLSSLRLGVTEMARYQSESWQPLYLVGVVPYVLVQRLSVQDEPDSAGALRNNVLAAVDAAWRVAPGTRVYGELLVDDLHTSSDDFPDKLAFQVGLEGVGPIRATRVTWGAEYTRVSRFVYTSYFGREFAAQGEPLGFFLGPDARRIRVRGAWDPGADWQLRAAAALTDQGESGLGRPFVPGSPSEDPFDFLGVVERTREFEMGARWWPASGVDLVVTAGYRWIENRDHVAGDDDDSPFARFALRLLR